jgi:hypothetical protein
VNLPLKLQNRALNTHASFMKKWVHVAMPEVCAEKYWRCGADGEATLEKRLEWKSVLRRLPTWMQKC